VEVHLGHLREDEVQELGAVEAADLGVEVELLDDVAGVGVEGGDPGAEVAGDLPGVGEDGPQVQARGVVGLDAGNGLEDGADGLDGQGLGAGEDLGLGGLQDAVEPAEQDEWQDDAAVLGPLVVAAQQIGDGPDQAGVVGGRGVGGGGAALGHAKSPVLMFRGRGFMAPTVTTEPTAETAIRPCPSRTRSRNWAPFRSKRQMRGDR
jgi:hypothetical protein